MYLGNSIISAQNSKALVSKDQNCIKVYKIVKMEPKIDVYL